MTGNDNSNDVGSSRPTPERGEQSPERLDEPVADRVTLARRLRAVERALSGAGDVEFDAREPDTRETEAVAERLDTVETRLDALDSAVRAIGECLVARDRARRTDDGVESVRRAVDALPETASGTDDPGERGRPDDAGRSDRPEDTGRSGRSDDPGRSGRPDDDPDTVTGAATDGLEPATIPGDEAGAATGESAAEWLDRVAAGGVTPPPVE